MQYNAKEKLFGHGRNDHGKNCRQSQDAGPGMGPEYIRHRMAGFDELAEHSLKHHHRRARHRKASRAQPHIARCVRKVQPEIVLVCAVQDQPHNRQGDGQDVPQ